MYNVYSIIHIMYHVLLEGLYMTTSNIWQASISGEQSFFLRPIFGNLSFSLLSL
jgi:hypothetical protein